MPAFQQLNPVKNKGSRPIDITGIENFHLNADCIPGGKVNGIREPNWYSFILNKPPGRKIFREPRTKFFKKKKKSVLSHITFDLEDDDHKPVDFHNETISFTCQQNKIY